MRDHLVEVLSAAPPDATPMDKIMLGVEAHLRHELDLYIAQKLVFGALDWADEL